MASLRARLLAGLLGLAAVGLVVLAAVTYAEQRSFLLERVDQQARSAPGAVARALDDGGVPGGRPELRRAGPGPGPPDTGPALGLPPGTLGQRRDLSGRIVGEIVFAYGEEAVARPPVPAKLEPGRLITVAGQGSDESRYRVFAQRDPLGTAVTVVALPLRDVDATLRRLLLVEGLVLAGVLVVLGALAWVVVPVALMPLDRLRRTADAIAGGDLSQRMAPADPRTEVGRLGLALDTALDRLEGALARRRASEERLRRLVADASHELRTPLASIRGSAALPRVGAVRDPVETQDAMRRIEQEAARMGVLVEDLLTLARLEEAPDAPHAEIDVAALARDVVDDARATAPDREIALAREVPAVALGDAHQLRQVLGNLLRHALVHTPAGTPIEVRVQGGDDSVRIEVRDHGPGLPAGDAGTAFERFWSSEGGRERGQGEAGLSLAIVAGIVAAHGGRVTAQDAPGGGAAFLVDLPAAPPDQPRAPRAARSA